MKNRLTLYILVGMVLGVIVGYLCHRTVGDAAEAKTIAGYFSIITDIFLRLVKMIIAPLVFATLVSGLAGMEGSGDVRRIGLRSVGWFVCASLFSLALGLVLANLLKPGAGLHMVQTSADVATGLNTAGLNFKDFVTHAFPTSIMLLVLMLSSKGMAGVARGSVVVVAAVAPMFHLPPSGVALILAIDQILDMGRTATNVIGNSIATAVIAKWEAKRVPTRQEANVEITFGQLQGETK